MVLDPLELSTSGTAAVESPPVGSPSGGAMTLVVIVAMDGGGGCAGCLFIKWLLLAMTFKGFFLISKRACNRYYKNICIPSRIKVGTEEMKAFTDICCNTFSVFGLS